MPKSMSEVASGAARRRPVEAPLKPSYDFIVCGAGSSGSVVARRLAEAAEVSVLLLEAGGSDDCSSVLEPGLWPTNVGSERDWAFQAEPNPNLNGRVFPMNMGKVLGGGSSINVMIWARGHRTDWDYFAGEAGDPGWNYASVLALYRRIEDWGGAPDPAYRGVGGLVYVQPAPDPNPIAPAMIEALRSLGLPTFDNPNGRMMEGAGGASLMDVRMKDGKRENVFRSYVQPYLDRPNLTVVTGALVTRLIFDGRRASGVQAIVDGQVVTLAAHSEIVLSLGAINTPKLLMQSGIGDERELRRASVPIVQHLPGVGRNFQDHFMIASCMWEFADPLPPRNNLGEAVAFWKTDSSLEAPDINIAQIEIPFCSPDLGRFLPGAGCWGLLPAVMRPRSRGRLRLVGPEPSDGVRIETDILSDPDDMATVLRAVELAREVGNSAALRPYVKREVMPGPSSAAELEQFVRDGAVSYWHQSCTAKMGRDPLSVVDGQLRVYGLDSLRIADASILPRITTGNTMAPCVIVGERAADLLMAAHGLSVAALAT